MNRNYLQSLSRVPLFNDISDRLGWSPLREAAQDSASRAMLEQGFQCVWCPTNNNANLKPFTATKQRPAYAVGSRRKQTLADDRPRQYEHSQLTAYNRPTKVQYFQASLLCYLSLCSRRHTDDTYTRVNYRYSTIHLFENGPLFSLRGLGKASIQPMSFLPLLYTRHSMTQHPFA